MKKLFAAAICTIISTLHILGMETNTLQIPQYFPYECSKHILLEYAQNVHRYVCEKHGYKNNREPSDIIFNVSLVNKDLYKELDKERNDPITARTIITNLKNRYSPCLWNGTTIKMLNFPGAKKCIALSKQLYDANLTIDKLEQLFTEGAIINCSVTQNQFYLAMNQPPLKYWYCISNRNTVQRNAIIEKLIELGADLNEDNIAASIITSERDTDLIRTLLKYKPRITRSLWHSVLSNNEYLDLLVSYATPDEMTDGLLECISRSFAPTTLLYQPEKMLKLINNGANPNIALHHLTEKLQRIPCSLSADTFFIKIFSFLCEQKAFDQTALDQLKNIQTRFSSFITTLENNRLK